MSEAERFLTETHDDGRTYGGGFKLKLLRGGSLVTCLYFTDEAEAQLAFGRVKGLRADGESVVLEKRRNLSRPFEWDLIDSA